MLTDENHRYDWVNLPRKFRVDLRSGKISATEFLVLAYIRTWANSYGVARVSNKNIQEDVLPQTARETVPKIMRRLKERDYIWFERRQGSRGAYEVRMGLFLREDTQMIVDPRPGSPMLSRSKELSNGRRTSDADAEPDNTGPTYTRPEETDKSGENGTTPSREIRSAKNENQKNKEISLSKRLDPGLNTEVFIPSSREESVLHEVAKKVGEKNMTYLLKKLEITSINTIERALGIALEEHRSKPKGNLPAYLNSIIEDLISKEISEGGKIKKA